MRDRETTNIGYRILRYRQDSRILRTMSRHAAVFGLLLGTLLAGCANLASKPAAPEVTLAGLRFVDAGLFEQRFALRLRLLNPNDFPIEVLGMNYKLLLDDRPFASGVSSKSVNVPAFGEGVTEVEAITNITRIVGQLKHLATTGQGQGPEALDYRIEGGIKLSNWGTKIPFEYEGKIGGRAIESSPSTVQSP
ncbi:MAG: LEA type 2 family protein [Gammaproteobacteria bacterium]|jgi:LEA14-like dessication related protein|nr:LEA type 2 family protein [Gammaproteobacteria bacterium]